MPVVTFSTGEPVAVLCRGIASARTGALKVDGVATAITGGTYSLQLKADGSVIQTGTVASGGAITAGITPAAGDAVGAARERWTVTTATATYVFDVPAIVAQSSIYCPVESGTISAAAPALSTFPGSQTSWWPQIGVAWGLIMMRIQAHTALAGSSDLWASGELLSVTLHGALALAYEAAAGYGAEPWVSLSDIHYRLYEEEWERLKLTYNTDADTAVEGTGTPIRTGQVSTAAARA